MSELTISSTNWLGISLRHGAAIVFNLSNPEQWQYLTPIVDNNQPKEADPNVPKQKQENEDDDESANDLNRNLIKFTPNGQKLAINGQNKQIYIYIPSDYETNQTYWQLERIITVKKRASAIDLTNKYLLIADKSGDVYQTDLSLNTNLALTADDCMIGHLSMLLDIMFIRTNENQEFILTADRDEKIRISHYPNAYNIQGYCLGHTEFVSHIKLVNQNHILSASGDGTLRLWHLPDCIQLNEFHSTIFTSSVKQIFYGPTFNYEETKSSSTDHSIWKLDISSSDLNNCFIALSLYANRTNSIYLTTLSNLQNSTNEPCQLIFNSTIIDYYFDRNSHCDLYVLCDNNKLIKLNLTSILSSDKKQFIEEDTNQVINKILSKNEFNLMNNIISNEIIFKQLFKTRGEPGDCSYYKRKNERIEQQEEKRKKKQNK